MAPATKPTPEAGTTSAPTEAKKVVPFPLSPEEINKRRLPERETLAIWARQEKAGIITLCNHKSEDGTQRCYYPATNTRDSSNDPIIKVDENGKTYALGTCSYAGDLHPPVRMYPPKKEDEI